MKKVSLLLTTVLCLTLMSTTAYAVPANPKPHEYIQPNGDTLTVRLFGDEHRHWRTTDDGVLITLNNKEFYCYAYVNKKGETLPGRKIAHNKNQRTRCENKYITRLAKRTLKNKSVKQ